MPAVRSAVRRLWHPRMLMPRLDFLVDVPALRLSYDGSSLVDAMADMADRGASFTQGTGANKPVFVASGVNGVPSLRSTDGLRGMSQSNVTASSIFQVGLDGDLTEFYFEHDHGGGVNGAYNIVAADAATQHVWVYVWTASGYTLYRNGNVQASASHSIFGTGVSDSGLFFFASDFTGPGPNLFGRMWTRTAGMATTCTLFNRSLLDRGAQGDVAIMGVRLGPTSTAERQFIEGWACWRTKLQGSMVAGHPYKNAPPSLAGYG